MKLQESLISREQFARWMFQHDMTRDMYPHGTNWMNLADGMRRSYFRDVDQYLKQDPATWPACIQRRLRCAVN